MLWQDVTKDLDNLRSKIRNSRNPKETAKISDSIFDEDLRGLCERVASQKTRTRTVELPVDDQGNVIYPTSAQGDPSANKQDSRFETGVVREGQYRAVVAPREKPAKPPLILELATEETLGKDKPTEPAVSDDLAAIVGEG